MVWQSHSNINSGFFLKFMKEIDGIYVGHSYFDPPIGTSHCLLLGSKWVLACDSIFEHLHFN